MLEGDAVMDKPELSVVQRRWLMEIGLDARMLAHLSAAPIAELPANDSPLAKAHLGSMPAGEIPAAEALVARTPHAEKPVSSVPADDGPRRLGELLRQAMPARSGSGQRDYPAERGGSQAPAELGSSAAVAVSGETAALVPDLQALHDHAETCQACGLHEVRGRIVFGEGVQQQVRWMFIGEAPGSVDDSTGRPFQGRPGELLKVMLQSAGIQDDAPAYFTHVLKCRPMGNRSPRPEEIAACLSILQKQIRLLKPASLVALGRVAASALLGGDGDLEALRGRVHEYKDADGRSIPLVVTHHPASLLLHGQLKAEAWRDLNLLIDQTLSA